MFARSALSSAKVAVLGAAGGIGQPLSLLCKLSPYIDTLSCYDVVGTPGVAADLSHCPTKSHTTGSLPDAGAGSWPEGSEGGLKAALEGGEFSWATITWEMQSSIFEPLREHLLIHPSPSLPTCL